MQGLESRVQVRDRDARAGAGIEVLGPDLAGLVPAEQSWVGRGQSFEPLDDLLVELTDAEEADALGRRAPRQQWFVRTRLEQAGAGVPGLAGTVELTEGILRVGGERTKLQGELVLAAVEV